MKINICKHLWVKFKEADLNKSSVKYILWFKDKEGKQVGWLHYYDPLYICPRYNKPRRKWRVFARKPLYASTRKSFIDAIKYARDKLC